MQIHVHDEKVWTKLLEGAQSCQLIRFQIVFKKHSACTSVVDNTVQSNGIKVILVLSH